MGQTALVAFIVLVAVFAPLFERHGLTPIAERHHRSHDTYAVASTLSRSIVAMMIFMAALGLALAWLCDLGVFNAQAMVILHFFAAFLAVALVIWLCMHHYQVVTFHDRMRVTPFVGRPRTIIYADIERMVWTDPSLFSGLRGVQVYSKGFRRPASIWGTLDVDRILMSINRFDVLEGLQGR